MQEKQEKDLLPAAQEENTEEKAKKSPNGVKKGKRSEKRPLSKTKKKVLTVVISVLLILAILASVLIIKAVLDNRPPDLETVRGRFEELLLAAPAVNDIFWGKGLPTYPRITAEGFSFKDTYGEGENAQEKNISGMIFTTEEGKTIVAYRAWMYFIPKGQDGGIYYDFERNVILSAKPDDTNYYRFAERTATQRPGEAQNAYLTEHLGGDGVYYYSLESFDLNAVFFYTEKDEPYYDYVKESSGYLTTDDIKAVAERVYSRSYLDSVYESIFTGIMVSEYGNGTLYARYYDYENIEDGSVHLVKSNKDEGYDLKTWEYDFSTMKMVKKSNATFVTVEVERYPAGDPAARETVRHCFALENGQWFLDSPSY